MLGTQIIESGRLRSALSVGELLSCRQARVAGKGGDHASMVEGRVWEVASDAY